MGLIDFERYANAASVVDLISGAAFTAAGGVALGVGANGRQCALFDGVDDCFTYTGIPTGWPAGANPGWIFAAVNQTLPGDVSGGRFLLCYGGGAGATRRGISQTNSGGVSSVRANAGDGSVSLTAIESTVAFSGRHVVFAEFGSASFRVQIDGVWSPTTAGVPATGPSRTRIGAADGSSATLFWQGDISALVVGAGVPDAALLANLNAWGASRK